jgi:hypothetical protein
MKYKNCNTEIMEQKPFQKRADFRKALRVGKVKM